MTGSTQEFFGGGWTEQKLAMLAKYLSAYTKALKKQRFERLYVDAFAGTGYRTQKEVEEGASIIKELAGEDAQGFLDGSARIALRAEPAFDWYIFVELAQSRFEALRTLKAEFPGLADRIQLEQADCNAFLQGFCPRTDWRVRRAVVFLDPYGMQVEWSTMEDAGANEGHRRLGPLPAWDGRQQVAHTGRDHASCLARPSGPNLRDQRLVRRILQAGRVGRPVRGTATGSA